MTSPKRKYNENYKQKKMKKTGRLDITSGMRATEILEKLVLSFVALHLGRKNVLENLRNKPCRKTNGETPQNCFFDVFS